MGIFSLGQVGPEEMKPTWKILTWANLVTFIRLLLIGLGIYLILVSTASAFTALVLVTAALLDVLDGYLARRLRQLSWLGVALDPAADRIAITGCAVALGSVGHLPWYAVIIIVVRDVIVIILASARTVQGRPVKVTIVGKIGSLSLMLLLPFWVVVGKGPSSYILGILFGCSMALYLVSATQYFKQAIAKQERLTLE